MKTEKALLVRMPEKMWEFLKTQSFKQNKSAAQIVREAIEDYKKNLKKGIDTQK